MVFHCVSSASSASLTILVRFRGRRSFFSPARETVISTYQVCSDFFQLVLAELVNKALFPVQTVWVLLRSQSSFLDKLAFWQQLRCAWSYRHVWSSFASSGAEELLYL